MRAWGLSLLIGAFMRTADVYLFGRLTGTLIEDDNGSFCFQYDARYLQDALAVAVSSTLPLRYETYMSDVLLFCG